MMRLTMNLSLTLLWKDYLFATSRYLFRGWNCVNGTPKYVFHRMNRLRAEGNAYFGVPFT